MPFDGSGNYSPPAAPTFPAVTGTVISSTYYNSTINDVASALGNCLTRDGQGKPSATIDWNGQILTGLASGLVSNLAVRFQADTATGLWLNGAGNLNLASGGVTRFGITSAGAAVTGTFSTSGLATLASAAVTAELTVGTTLGVTGVTTLSAALNGTSAALSAGLTVGTTLGVTGAATLSSTLGVTGATTLSSALTYGGVTLANAVTGTGNMVLSASPTITGTLTAAAITASGAVATGALTVTGTLSATSTIQSTTEFRLANSFTRVATVDSNGGWGGGYNFVWGGTGSATRDSTGSTSGFAPRANATVEVFAAGSGAAGSAISPMAIFSSTGLAVTGTLSATGAISSQNSIKSSSATAGVGYATGAGGTVTQITSKSTGVTINKVCGQITTHNQNLIAGGVLSFTVTNSTVAATDTITLNLQSGATAQSYRYWIESVAAGSFVITMENRTGTGLAEALVLNFTVNTGVTS